MVESKPRLLANLIGIGFSVVLMFVQIGFLNGIYDSQTHLIELMDADLIIVHRHKIATFPKRPFPRSRLVQARSVPGVSATYPVYLEEYRSLWKNDINGREYPIRVLAFDPDDPIFLKSQVRNQAAKLRKIDSVLIDSLSNPYYGSLKEGVRAELNGHEVLVVGVFSMGPHTESMEI